MTKENCQKQKNTAVAKALLLHRKLDFRIIILPTKYFQTTQTAKNLHASPKIQISATFTT